MKRTKKVLALTMVAASMLSSIAFAGSYCPYNDNGHRTYSTSTDEYDCGCVSKTYTCRCGEEVGSRFTKCHHHRFEY